MSCYAIGVDLGQTVDHAAAALLEYEPLPERDYRLRGLHRYPLGTQYTSIADDIQTHMQHEALRGRTMLAVDATGVGDAVVQVMRNLLPSAPVYRIWITGGSHASGSSTAWNVPKHDLVSTTSVIFEQDRIRIAPNMDDTGELVEELRGFHRTSERGYDSYCGAAGVHDDLVLALSLALWAAEQRDPVRPYRGPRISVPKGRIPGVDRADDLNGFYRFY
jgi:hypothetical protein